MCSFDTAVVCGIAESLRAQSELMNDPDGVECLCGDGFLRVDNIDHDASLHELLEQVALRSGSFAAKP